MLKSTEKSTCLTLPTLFLLRNKLPKEAGRSNRDLKLTAGTRAAGEAGGKGRHLASSAGWPSWGCSSFPSVPCSVLTRAEDVLLDMGLVCHATGVSHHWCVTHWCISPSLVCHPTEPLPCPLPAFLLAD